MRTFNSLRICVCLSMFLVIGGVSAHGQDSVLKRLNDSPRHHEWVEIQGEGHEVVVELEFLPVMCLSGLARCGYLGAAAMVVELSGPSPAWIGNGRVTSNFCRSAPARISTFVPMP